MTAGVSRLRLDDGDLCMVLSPGHSVTVRWVRENARDLLREWRAARTPDQRDAVARRIESRLEILMKEDGELPRPKARVLDEMAVVLPQAALRAEVLLAMAQAGTDIAAVRRHISTGGGLDLSAIAPALPSISDFYQRHALAIHARLDREIAVAGVRDLPSYMACWTWDRPPSGTLHDLETALVVHAVADVIAETTGHGREALRSAERFYEQTADRIAVVEWTDAVERGDVALTAEMAGPDVSHDLDMGA